MRVLRSDALPAAEGIDSTVRPVRAGSSVVLVARVPGRGVVAFAPRCPHEGTDLEQATFLDGQLRCPRHNYLYDPVSGENVVPARVARPTNLWKLHPGYLPTFRAEEHDGWIWVAATPNPPPPGWDPAREQRPPGARIRAGGPPPSSVAAGGDGAASAAPGTPVEHPPTHLRVQVDAPFELRLPTRAAPGRVWRVEAAAGDLVVVGQSFEPGDPPRQRIRLVARRVGRTTLRALYGQPWEAGCDEIRSYEIEVRAPAEPGPRPAPA